jgi:hypothetical protein
MDERLPDLTPNGMVLDVIVCLNKRKQLKQIQ